MNKNTKLIKNAKNIIENMKNDLILYNICKKMQKEFYKGE